jgi:hypothetical protein
VRPIFEQHCYECHGAKKQKSGLRLDLKATALKGGDEHGPNIVAGKVKESSLLQMVTSDDKDERMPPKGERLSAAEIATLTAWIEQGAVWPESADLVKVADPRDHWSFRPVANPAPPATADQAWPRNAIDRFVLARLEREGLRPSPEAERRSWLRRVCFDLTGLPPSPEQVAAFVDDTRADAYERATDELLKSPRYGEHWAQHWLDVARYADTHGFEVNTERPNAWPYRDYVIRAFNDDTPYDRFIREQIAGDAVGEDAATGFLVTASVLLPGQIGKDEPSKRQARQDSLDEIVTNIGQTFLGLTVGCARCHDHKFDPIPQRDYYAMQAFVAGVQYEERDLRTPAAEARRKEIAQLKAEVAKIDQELARFAPPSKAGVEGEEKKGKTAAFSTEGLSAEEAKAANALVHDKTALEARVKTMDVGLKAFAGTFRTPDDIHLLNRGDPEQPKAAIAPAALSALGAAPLPSETAEQERRVALADWIASPRNPLTARVMVNRIWQGHFGAGLVETPSDFGHNGARPSHPELLDWLAREFMRSGWSVKQLHRLVVLSATYRQASRIDPAALARDADDRLLWRYPSRRVDAEMIRDAMLFVSGRLDLKMYGPGFNLFDKRGGLSGFQPVESFSGEGLRRMIYAHKVRREREAVFGAFDCPDAGQATARRRASTTPIQALNLLNSQFTIDESNAFAARVALEAGADLDAQTRRVYQRALSREPSGDELREAAGVARGHGLATLCRALFNSNEVLFLP